MYLINRPDSSDKLVIFTVNTPLIDTEIKRLKLLLLQLRQLLFGREVAEGDTLSRIGQHVSQSRFPEGVFHRLQSMIQPAMKRA